MKEFMVALVGIAGIVGGVAGAYVFAGDAVATLAQKEAPIIQISSVLRGQIVAADRKNHTLTFSVPDAYDEGVNNRYLASFDEQTRVIGRETLRPDASVADTIASFGPRAEVVLYLKRLPSGALYLNLIAAPQTVTL